MVKRKRQSDPALIEQAIRDRWGQGSGEHYKPWLQVKDVPSQGVSSRIQGWTTGRVYEFFSQHELHYFYLLDWSSQIVDIREQYPLLPLTETLFDCSTVKRGSSNSSTNENTNCHDDGLCTDRCPGCYRHGTVSDSQTCTTVVITANNRKIPPVNFPGIEPQAAILEVGGCWHKALSCLEQRLGYEKSTCSCGSQLNSRARPGNQIRSWASWRASKSRSETSRGTS